MSVVEELQKLQQLHESGALNDEEYAQAKAQLLGSAGPAELGTDPLFQQTCTWAMILHFSQFTGYLLPVAGFLVPVLIWQFMKDQLPGLDAHGKVVTNWIISSVVYWILSGFLFFFLIGIPMLYVMGIVSIVFPIVGGIKAANGVVWRYPLSINFFD